MKSLIYLIGHILFQIFKITLNLTKKKHGENTDKPSIRIYRNEIENRITFEIKQDIFSKFQLLKQ